MQQKVWLVMFAWKSYQLSGED